MSAGLDEFNAACELDRRGNEAEAVGRYRAALALGLSDANRRSALLGLGSSLRNTGAFAESVAVLEAATSEFPESRVLQAFLALSLHSAGRSAEAVATLLDVVLGHVSFDGYEGALRAYRDELTN